MTVLSLEGEARCAQSEGVTKLKHQLGRMTKVVDVYQIVSTFSPRIGGAQRATETLSRGLIQQGYNVEVLTTWYPGLRRYEIVSGVPVRRLGFGGPGKLASLSFGLHTLFWTLWYGRATPLVHVQNIQTPLLVGMLLSLLMRKQWVITIHGEWIIPRKRRTFLGRFRLYMMRQLGDHFVALSKGNRQVLLAEGISPDRISLIPNGIDVSIFHPPQPEERRALRAHYGYAVDDVVVLFLGRLVLLKRVDLLLRVIAHLGSKRGVKCVIVGDGPEMGNLKTLVRDLALNTQVRFTGPVGNVRDFHWLSDVFVLPSQFEGLPVALLESMACGTAVLVTRCAGNLEAVTDGANGLTCDIDDEAHLAQQLQRLVYNGDLRRRLGKEARQTILERYSMEAVAAAHLRVYARVLDGPDDAERRCL